MKRTALLFLLSLAALLPACAPLMPRTAPEIAGKLFRDCKDCPELVVLAGGTVLRGSLEGDDDRWDDVRERPAQRITIARPFAIARHEITRAQFSGFVAETFYAAEGCAEWTGQAWVHRAELSWRNPGFEQNDNHPVVCVSWQDAKAFTAWLTRTTGALYRLPTEAEWEYAARAGTATSRYWGDGVAEGCRYANIGDRSLGRVHPMEGLAPCDDGHAYTAPVGSFLPNAFGLHDMLGNVWEWSEDCWLPGYVGAPADGSARLDGDCAWRVPRGASWNSHYRNVRSSNRGTYRDARYIHIGIRVVRELGR